MRKAWNKVFKGTIFEMRPKVPVKYGKLGVLGGAKSDDPPPPNRYFETSFEADLHALFVLLIVNSGYVLTKDNLDTMFGHDLRPGSLTKAIEAGCVRLGNNGSLSVTEEGARKLRSLQHSGKVAKGVPK